MVRQICFILLFFMTFSAVSPAGGFQFIDPESGDPVGWEAASIPYYLDPGSLGRYSNTQVAALLAYATAVWEGVETAAIQFEFQGKLAADVHGDNASLYLRSGSCTSTSTTGQSPSQARGESPIILDDDGAIMDSILGEGSSLIALTRLRCISGTTSEPENTTQYEIILDGRFFDGETGDGKPELSTATLAGVLVHELGHLLGLTHAAFNDDLADADDRLLPTMYPSTLGDNDFMVTLSPDDEAAVSVLYPAADVAPANISGSVVFSDGSPIRGLVVTARSLDDPLCHAYQTLTGMYCLHRIDGASQEKSFFGEECSDGDTEGNFLFQGLPAGQYVLEVAEMNRDYAEGYFAPFWDGPELPEIPGSAEFFNAGDVASESSYAYTILTVGEGEVLTDLEIILADDTEDDTELVGMPLDYYTSDDHFSEAEDSVCLDNDMDFEALITAVTGESVDTDLATTARSAGCQLRPEARPAHPATFMTAWIFGLLASPLFAMLQVLWRRTNA